METVGLYFCDFIGAF